jgi:hypothetical protein
MINPKIETKNFIQKGPTEKIWWTTILKNNPLERSLQKLESTFSWLGFNKNSIINNLKIDVKNQK